MKQISPLEPFKKIKEKTTGLSENKKIKKLKKEYPPAFFDFVTLCSSENNYGTTSIKDVSIYFASKETLEAFGLIDKNGQTTEKVKEKVLKFIIDKKPKIKPTSSKK